MSTPSDGAMRMVRKLQDVENPVACYGPDYLGRMIDRETGLPSIISRNAELIAAIEKVLACVDKPGGGIRSITSESIINLRSVLAKEKSS